MRRRRYGARKKTEKGHLFLVGLLMMSIVTGYFATKYFIKPYIFEGKQWAWKSAENESNETIETIGENKNIDESKGASTVSSSGVITGEQKVEVLGDENEKEAEKQSQMDKNPQTGTGLNQGDAPSQTREGDSTDSGAPASAAAGSSAVSTTADSSASNSGVYAVQFGSFSTKQAAESMVSQLKSKNISSYVMEKDEAYKVLGMSFDTKEKASQEAQRLRPEVSDVYVVSM